MADSISSDFSSLDLEDSTSVSNLNTAGTSTNDEDLEATVQSLINRCTTLYEEVGTYIEAVIERQKITKVQHPVEYRNLRNDFKNELAFLKKIVNSGKTEEKVRHFIVSSNLTYYEALWGAAKRSRGLQAFRKYYFWDRHKAPAGKRTLKGLSLGRGGVGKCKTAALVDIVADEGREWIRVSTVSEKRIIFDLAKLGWVNDSDSDNDMPDARSTDWEDEDDEDQVDVVRNARELARAARANPVQGRPPKVRLVLTRIVAGKMKDVDAIIAKIRATGAIVQCAADVPPPQPLQAVLNDLLVDRTRALSDTLNIDCTILLALVSDISHKPCPILDWYPGEVQAQIKEEAGENLLPTQLYPAIGSHSMVCTEEAAEQMNLIVDTLATDEEKRRCQLLIGQGDCEGRSSEDLVAEWASMSNHPVPTGFTLPIRIVPSDIDTITERLPTAACKLQGEMSRLNTSIFFYGWAEGITTLSSNRARARQIEHAINQHGLEDGEAGPHIWLCGESRSLIAKHGRRGPR
ncbi:uncharacterized protein M421DRAFT_415629 [Didymella exigua CBS 183.55]|uniref:Uncharacterized protein n=1 Tax=Didymella exigua CBS 183.55 TaxID=1150837 RepID=A0A6A5RXR5_9PLEO|nr:uncharacterized protein M421DRAFT_415629 [Didymella exigua CBS 183.55]KAF1933285.1 hypothetical protein M421DRAFT_415629 [Didymella exigua CBS 183.55]